MTIAFDLDDTLYHEADFVKSAYHAIARKYDRPDIERLMLAATNPRDAFDAAAAALQLPDATPLLKIYREHFPDIQPLPGVMDTLWRWKEKGVTLALITDGRSLTQRNKILALGLDKMIDPGLILISEESGADKLSSKPFETVEKAACNPPYFYIGDNPAKDFLHPNLRGWTTIMLRDGGSNIHPQNLQLFPSEFHPAITVENWQKLSQMTCL